MSRKRPSRHSEDQFALFLERIRGSLGSEDEARFDEAVSSLIRRRGEGDKEQGRGAPNGGPSAGHVRPQSSPGRPALRPAVGKSDPLMVQLGQLVIGWSDNEGLLLQVLTLLLETDEKSAAAVQSVLDSTDVRLGLVRRLALLKLVDPSLRQSLAEVLEGVRKVDRTRDEFLRHGFANGRLAGEGGADTLQEVQHELRMLNRMLTDLVPQLRTALGNR